MHLRQQAQPAFSDEEYYNLNAPICTIAPTDKLGEEKTRAFRDSFIALNVGVFVPCLSNPSFALTAIAATLVNVGFLSALMSDRKYRLQQSETIHVDGDNLVIVSNNPAHNMREKSTLGAFWAKAVIERKSDNGLEIDPRLVIRSERKALRIGEFLTEDELQDAADSINEALECQRQPNF